jgi:tryptophan-rich sensory protein
MSRFLDDWGPTLVAAAGVSVVAVAGAVLTELGPWYYSLCKPSWQPPDWLFGPAWTLIFILEAAAGVIAWHHVQGAGQAALLVSPFVANGILNILWSLFFFKMHRPDYALREVGFLWASIVAMMVVVGMFAGAAWLFLLPYLLWVSFAAFLNYTIDRLNAPFGKTA